MLAAVCLGLSFLGAERMVYVDPKGNDAWSGSRPTPNRARSDGPLRSLAAAQSRVRTLPKEVPVRVHIASGEYRIETPLVFGPDDGSAQAPRIWEGPAARESSAAPAVVSGLRRIQGWRKTPQGWFVTKVPDAEAGKWNFIQLFVNGERRYRPRLPKKGYYSIAEHADPTPESKGKGNDRFQFKPGEIRADWANRDEIDVLAFHEWIMSRNRIKEVDSEHSIVTFKAPTGTDAPWRDFLKGHRYLVENVKGALGTPGEWYLDRPTGVLTYVPMPGEKLEGLRVEAPIAETLVEVRGDLADKRWVEGLRFAGLTFEGTNWTAPATGRNFPQAEADLPGAIRFVGARHCQVGGCDIRHTGGYGIEIGPACKRIVVAKNRLADLGAGGVKVGETSWQKDPDLFTEDCAVQVNFIEGGGRIHPAAVGVWVGQNAKIHIGGNFIHDFFYTGISVGWSWGYQENGARENTILSNRISLIGQGVLSDMGGIYTLGPQPGTVIRGNRIHDVRSFSYGGWGIYPDEGSTGIVIEENCVFRTKSAGFHQHYGRENIIRNNVFAFGDEAQLMRTRAEPHLSFTMERNVVLFGRAPLLGSNWSGDQFRLDRNLYWREGGGAFDFAGQTFDAWKAKGQDIHSVIADPLFRDPARGDFRLKPGSPAIGLGFRAFPALDPANDGAAWARRPPAFPLP